MNKKLTIRIKKPKQTDLLLGILFWFPFLLEGLTGLLDMPRAIAYTCDAAWCLLLGYIFLSGRRGDQPLGIWIWLFFIYTVLTYLPQWQSPLYYLWGMRNNFRFYAAFFAFAVFLKAADIADYWNLFDKLFWVDIAASVYQFFLLGIDGDQLGGLFSTETGGNGYTNIFFLIIVTKSIVFYLEKRESLSGCIAKCGAALVVAALAELKFFFVEVVIVMVLVVLFTSFSWRKLAVILGGTVGVMLCVSLLTSLFPGWMGWFSLEWLLEVASSDRGYTSSGDLNRLNAIRQINELWLTDGWKQMFGLGLGNCDTSTYAILQTPFNTAYNRMHYIWFSHAMMYLETGWIGLLFYWGFFVLVFFQVRKIERRCEGTARSYCRVARIMAVLCVGISIYNSSLRTEAAYMAYFVLAVPFSMNRQQMCRKQMSSV